MNIRYTLHRLSLLQQWHRDSTRLIFFLIFLLAFSAVVAWILPLFKHGNIYAGFIGLACGLGINFWLTCISQLHVARQEQPLSLKVLLQRCNYHEIPQGYYTLQVAHYKKSKTQRIYIDLKDGMTVLPGPHNILRKIARRLDEGSRI
ncbi:hypothetical protein ACQK5W_09360 [Pantoea sp. FN060301]|uniref:hypothetical protein n=1 Tax=Pantoea sp. FN060301 TaxID=3420380 RepID=UPI003D18295C